MRWLLVLLVVAGCRTAQYEPSPHYMRNWNDPPPIKPMPNWIMSWDHTKPKSPRRA